MGVFMMYWTQVGRSFMEMCNGQTILGCVSKLHFGNISKSFFFWKILCIELHLENIGVLRQYQKVLQQYLAIGIVAMLVQRCNCSCITAVLQQ